MSKNLHSVARISAPHLTQFHDPIMRRHSVNISKNKLALTMTMLGILSTSQVACAQLSGWDSSERYGNPQVMSPTPVHTSTSKTTTYRRSGTLQTTIPRTTYPSEQYRFDTPSAPSYPQSQVSNTGYSGVDYFRQAQDAARRGDDSALYEYEQMMSGSLLAMYPTYWRLDNNLSSLHPSVVEQFVRQYNGSVMAEKLVADYAEVKAQAGDYASVRQVANLIVNADRSEACAIALGYNNSSNRQDKRYVQDIKPKVWLTTRKQPELCQQLGTEMINNPAVSRLDREQRLLRMIREGRTGDIIALSQSIGVPISYSDLSSIQLNANDFLTQFNMLPINQAMSQKNQYLYIYAIARMADKSYREASMQLDYDVRQDDLRAQKRILDTARQYSYRILGVKRMNSNTDDGFNDEAVRWFRLSQGLPFNFEEAEDYAQAAIRFSQWGDVLAAIESMDNKMQSQPIWQYWRARAYEQMGGGNTRKATRIYQTLAQQHDYYGLLAKDKLKQTLNVASLGGTQLPSVTGADRARVMQNPHFARAFALYDGGIDASYANREWNWAVKQAKDNRDNLLILAAAKIAHDKGWLDRAVYAIDNADGVHSLALSHPMPYRASVIRYSNAVGIDPAWAYGIMRQESRFVNTARSGVGASGLMQIMPDTGRYIARKLGESYSASRVNSGDTNIRYGTWYMSDVLAKLDYQPVLATAGYNAGPNKARRWQPVYGTLPADQYIESIAYPETRNYVKRVMENATIYSSLLGRAQPITQRMGAIPPAY